MVNIEEIIRFSEMFNDLFLFQVATSINTIEAICSQLGANI
jgi:hypothetical protein